VSLCIAVTGGTGLIGPAVCKRLAGQGARVLVITRNLSRARPRLPDGVEAIPWPEGPEDEETLRGIDAIVNLAGEPIAQRWTPAVKARLRESRVGALDRLFGLVERSTSRPAVLVSASAIGYYGARGDEPLTEETGPGSGFLANLCVSWEEAARRFEGLGLRTALVRIGVVLAKEGGALGRMLPLFRLGVGGPVGSGRQWMSWIHHDDLADLVAFALRDGRVAGALNGTAPEPVTNAAFAAAMGHVLRRPAFVPAPGAALRVVLGEMATIVLDGQKVLPKRAQELGFPFQYPSLKGALRQILA
jgi:uncharacterized protein (TIGR01777 family)